MQHFPIFLDLRGRVALVLGEGPAAERKADMLARAGAVLRRAVAFSPALLDGVAVAIGAEASEGDLTALHRDAVARGIPVNVVDRPALCSFITPAVVDRAPLVVAVGSGGAAPVLARLIRARIEAMLPPRLGQLAALGAEFQAEIRRRFPALGARRRLLERLFAGRVAALALAGDAEAARRAVGAEMDAAEAGGSPAGIVHLLGSGAGPADLLTLRALRVLGEADVVVHATHSHPDVLDLARRDAELVAVDGDASSVVADLAEAGKAVVRLDPAPGEGGVLRMRGVAVVEI